MIAKTLSLGRLQGVVAGRPKSLRRDAASSEAEIAPAPPPPPAARQPRSASPSRPANPTSPGQSITFSPAASLLTYECDTLTERAISTPLS
jgi:hypothetical protein